MATVLLEKVSADKVRAMVALDSVSREPETTPALLKGSSSFSGVRYVNFSDEELLAKSPAMSSFALGPTSPLQAQDGEAAGTGAEEDNMGVYNAKLAGISAGVEKVGWVTLVKDGKKLVTSRVRQSANTRQQHAQQWTRRIANDQAQKSAVHSSHTISLELSSDATGIGFAFGGIYPGIIHAHGNLVENHSVSYSIGALT